VVGGYGSLFAAGFRRQSTYRAALLTGLAANVFFGIFRSAIFVTLYRHHATASGLDRADALTYVWVLQTLFGVIFTSWTWEFPEAVRSGDFVHQLLRPGDAFMNLLAVDVGRSSFALLARGLPQLVLPALVLDLHVPTSLVGILAMAASFVLCAAASFEMRFLFGSLSFWTADYRGWWSLLFGSIWLSGGFVVPVEYFPGVLRAAATYGPVAAFLALPVRVVTGRGVMSALGLQLLWTVVGIGVCRAVMKAAERKLVVHGG
jgi:ABC-2 type transport system permease protein